MCVPMSRRAVVLALRSVFSVSTKVSLGWRVGEIGAEVSRRSEAQRCRRCVQAFRLKALVEDAYFALRWRLGSK
jgi:hypothetical protein